MADLETANQVLKQAVEQMAEGVGGLIGESVECTAVKGEILSIREFSRRLKGKVVLSRFEVDGDWSGEVFLVAGVTTVIVLGGSLINTKSFDGEENSPSPSARSATLSPTRSTRYFWMGGCGGYISRDRK